MGAEPSIEYVIDLESGVARVFNPLFPNQRIDIPVEIVNNEADPERELRRLLYDEYRKKYF